MARTQTASRHVRRQTAIEIDDPPRIDRWAWAEAILDGTITVGLDGIHDEDGRRYHGKYAAICGADKLGEALTYSETYMNAYMEQEIEYYCSIDYDDQWEEYCEEYAKEHDLEADDIAELIADKDKRRDWAYERWDAEWAWDQIKEDCKDIGWVAWFLKKHPVAAIRPNRDSDFIELDDIVGFCRHCDEPFTVADSGSGIADDFDDLELHRYSGSHCPDCSSDVTCSFDGAGQPRSHFKCPSCGHYTFNDTLDDKPGERPLTWPPGVPFPPRKDFAGGPDWAPPWEDPDA